MMMTTTLSAFSAHPSATQPLAKPRKKLAEPNDEPTATDVKTPKKAKGDVFKKASKPDVYEDAKKLDVVTPDGHLLIENKGKTVAHMNVSQGHEGSIPTSLTLTESDNKTIDVFTKFEGQDTFHLDSISVQENPKQFPHLVLYKNASGDASVRDFLEVDGLPEPLAIDYSQENGRPIIKAPLFSFKNALVLGEGQLPHDLTLYGPNRTAPNFKTKEAEKGWNPYLQYPANPRLGDEKAQVMNHVQVAVEEWYQRVHPDELLKEGSALPLPTLKSLGVSAKSVPTADAKKTESK